MLIILYALAILVGVHLIAAVVATRVIARRVEDANPPGGVFVRIGGGRLHLYDLAPQGGGDGPAILLIHGATSNARDMVVAIGNELARRHRVIAVDRPGHGWSDRPDGRADASPARQADLIGEALATLGVDKVVVVGHSLAGAVATNLALDHQDLVSGLVLLAAVTHPWPGGVTWYYRLAATPLLGDIFVNTLMAPMGALGLEASAAGAFSPLSGPPDYAGATAASLVLRPSEFKWNGEDVTDLKPFVSRQFPRYGEIAVPTAILASDDDTVVATTIHAVTIAGQIPGARLTVLHGKGHQIHYTARDAVLAEIERVMREAAPGSRQESRSRH
jgi:pimeloyl-ACP methyl ester carboxylesterase